MGLNAGEVIYFRPIQEMSRYEAVVVSVNDESIELQTRTPMSDKISLKQYIVISGEDFEYYTEVTGIEGSKILLKRMWTERRSYFRVDDVFPVVSRKVEESPDVMRSRVVSELTTELASLEPPDESVNPRLWDMLVDIRTKLDQIIGRLNLESEGMAKAESKRVNVSASGIRFLLTEEVRAGDTVEVKMSLPTSPPTVVITYGIVVRAVAVGEGKFDVALHFHDMDDDVRGEIIQYTLNRQRELIRQQRRQRGNDA